MDIRWRPHDLRIDGEGTPFNFLPLHAVGGVTRIAPRRSCCLLADIDQPNQVADLFER
jgi:hypothetical protein